MKRIYKINPNISNEKDTFRIGLYLILDGLVSVLTLGRYHSDFSSEEMISVMMKGIKKRRKERERLNKTS